MRITLSRVTRAFASAGVYDLDLHVESGEILTVVGPSGAGKTTLLRLIAGLEAVDSGHITIGEIDVTRLAPERRDVGLVAQRAAIYPHLNVRRNLSIGLEMRRDGTSQAELQRRVEEAIALLDLTPVLNRRPEELSGGEAQRVALGRLLVRRPPVWLLDEPLAHLDARRKMEFRRHLHLLRAARRSTMILVTHDPVEALALGQQVAVLEGGRLRQVGAPSDLYERPADRVVAALVGWPPMNLADGFLVRAPGADVGLRFAAADGSFHLPMPAELATPRAEGQPVTVGIRPDELVATSPGSPLATGDRLTLPGWRVVGVEFVPPRRLLSVEKGNVTWRLWVEQAPAVRESLDLVLPPGKLHWFDGRGLRFAPGA